MKPVAKIICCGIGLAWLHGAMAAEVTVSDQGGSVVLESLSAPPGMAAVAPSPAPASAGTGLPPPAPAVQDGGGAARVTVQPHYEKVDRANIEKRMDDRAARTQKRKASAEKDAAERAARELMNPAQPAPDVQVAP